MLGEEYVTRAFATADSFNIEFQQLVTEYCWGEVWGRSGLTDQPAQPQQPLPARRAQPARGVQDALPRRASQRVHARRAARHADPDHGLRRRPGGRRGVPARLGRCSKPRASHRSRRRDSTPTACSASSGWATWAGRWRRGIAAAGFELVCFDAAGTADRLPTGACTRRRDVADVGGTRRHRLHQRARRQGDARRSRTTSRPPPSRRVTTVVDLSTVGSRGRARGRGTACGAPGITLCRRARVGRRGRRAGRHDLVDVRRARRSARGAPADPRRFAGNVFHVGEQAGQGQAMKLLNNFLSATALAATSEALAFGAANGLDLADDARRPQRVDRAQLRDRRQVSRTAC